MIVSLLLSTALLTNPLIFDVTFNLVFQAIWFPGNLPMELSVGHFACKQLVHVRMQIMDQHGLAPHSNFFSTAYQLTASGSSRIHIVTNDFFTDIPLHRGSWRPLLTVPVNCFDFPHHELL